MRVAKQNSYLLNKEGTITNVINSGVPGTIGPSIMYLRSLLPQTIEVKAYSSPDDAFGLTILGLDLANLAKMEDNITDAGEYAFLVGAYHKIDIITSGAAIIDVRYTE